MKCVVFDSSSLIGMSMSCLLGELKKLKGSFDGKFIITREVESEVVTRPISIKKFELEAMRVKQLIDEKILEFPEDVGVKSSEVTKKINEIDKLANNAYLGKREPIKIIHSGETSCIALCQILNEKKIENVLCVDERTTRLLIEKPENLLELLQRKLHTEIRFDSSKIKNFGKIKVLRSTELMYVAYKKKLLDVKGPQVLDALLYALKFKGCSISDDEIKEIKNLK